MSIELLSRIWNYDVAGNTRAVLQVLCDYANDDGVCWPSNDRIAFKVGVSKRQVQNILIDLHSRGVVETLEKGGAGPRSTNKVIVHLSALAKKGEAPKGEKGEISTDKDEISENKGEVQVSPEPSLIEPSLIEPPVYTKTKKTPNPTNEKPKPRSLHLMPDDFLLTPERQDYAIKQGLTVVETEDLFERMRLWSESTGGKYLNWDSAWMNWCRMEAKKVKEKLARQPNYGKSGAYNPNDPNSPIPLYLQYQGPNPFRRGLHKDSIWTNEQENWDRAQAGEPLLGECKFEVTPEYLELIKSVGAYMEPDEWLEMASSGTLFPAV